MTISVIVATYSRFERVKDLLGFLLKNSRLPDEVIFVEQGDVDTLRKNISDYFKYLNIKIIYHSVPSAAQARQKGMENSTGEILVFLDDDMFIDENYLAVAEKYLNNNYEVNALTGSYTKGEPAWTFKRYLGVLFLLYSFKKQNIVLPSGNYDFVRGDNLKKEQIAEWLFGGNMIVRRKIFTEGISFNPNFLRWSFGEDVMFSYKIHKKYPNSMRYLPDLIVEHKEGKENKMVLQEVIKMKIIYRYIFWKQEVSNRKICYTLAYLWSQFGLMGLDLVQTKSFLIFKTQIKTYLYLFKNKEKIISGQVDYNKFIFN